MDACAWGQLHELVVSWKGDCQAYYDPGEVSLHSRLSNYYQG